MRLAFIHNTTPGGAARAIAEQARRLAARGHSVELWTLDPPGIPAPPGLTQRTAGHYEPWIDLGNLSVAASPLGPLEARRLDRAYAALAEAVNGESYDAVLTEGCRFVQQPRVHRRLRAPSVIYANEVHRFVHERPPGIGAKRLALAALAPWHALLARQERAELAAARIVLANSRATAARIAAIHGIEPRVAHLGVDVDAFHPLGLEREPFVLCPAALHRRKRQDLVIEALALVPAARRPRLVLVYPSAGAGHLERLTALARARSVELELRPGVTDEALIEAYNRASLVVYVPEEEPFGLVALEAMACGTPFVGAAEGGLRETIEDGVTGVLVAAEASVLGKTIDELQGDAPRRERLGAAGRARAVERWSWERSVDPIEAALLEVSA